MAFVKQAIADAKEPELMPEDEYDLRIVAYTEKDSKKGKPMIECIIEFEEYPDAEPIFHYLNLVSADDTEKAATFKLRMMRRFLEAFNVPFEDDGFDTDDLDGATGRCVVYQQERVNERDEPTGEFSHALRLPKFGGEEAEEEEERPARRGAKAAPPRRGRRAEPEEEDVEEEVEEEVVEEEEEEAPPPRRGAKTVTRRRPAEEVEEEAEEEEPPPRRAAAKKAAARAVKTVARGRR